MPGTWTYSGDPATSELDAVRFQIQDTDLSRKLLTDEELNFLLERQRPLYNDPLIAAEQACRIISIRYAGETSISADGVTIDTTGLRQAYIEAGAELRALREELQGVAPAPWAGGIDPFDDCDDFGALPKVFGIGEFDNPLAGRQNYGSNRGRVYWPGNGHALWP